MRLSALLAAAVLLCVLGGAVATVPAAGTSTAGSTADAPASLQTQAVTPDVSPATLHPINADADASFDSVVALETSPETEFRVVLHDDRSATWNITVEYELETDAQREAFDDLATDIEGGTAEGPLGAERFERLVAVADDSTDREMSMIDVDRSAERHEGVGTVSLEFTWVAFLDTEDEQLVLDDALTTPDGDPLLGSLESQQQLIVVTPDGYQVDTTPGINPDIREGNAWIEGPQQFTVDERLVITYSPVTGAGPTPSTPTATPTPAVPDDSSWAILGAALLIGAAILLAALLYRRKGSDVSAADGVVPTAGSDTSSSAGSGTGVDAGPDEREPSDAGEEDPPDLSLLSDEERVERLLDRNDGRMRQAAIVEETGWSDAKVSQLLSSMAEQERIEKLRLGRENLISLPDGEDAGAEDAGADDDAE